MRRKWIRGEWIRGEWIKDTPTTEKKSEAERRMGISSEGDKLRSERERQVRGRRREGWCDGGREETNRWKEEGVYLPVIPLHARLVAVRIRYILALCWVGGWCGDSRR